MRSALLALLLTSPMLAGLTERRLAWSDLPQDLAGQPVKITRHAAKPVSATLVRIEPEGLVIEDRKGRRTIPKAEVASIETSRRKPPKWALIGLGIGAGATSPILAIATIHQRNEGGINGNKVIGASAALMAGAGALGYFAGRAADVDRTVFHILAR